MLTTRGGDFELQLGQDVSIGYLSHTDTSVRLYLQESLTFQLLTAEAVVPLTPAAPEREPAPAGPRLRPRPPRRPIAGAAVLLVA